MPEVSTQLYCGHCGERTTPGAHPPSSANPPSPAHERCEQRLAMEPPRYCASCRRRMKVQVTPMGWTAECSRHGTLAAGAAS